MIMSAKVKVRINELGVMERIDVEGAVGNECLEMTDKLKKAAVRSNTEAHVDLKEEYYLSNNDYEKESQTW